MDSKLDMPPNYQDSEQAEYPSLPAPAYIRIEEDAPYEEYNQHLLNANNKLIATYTSEKTGILKKKFIIINEIDNQTYISKVGFREGTIFYNNLDQPVVKMIQGDFNWKLTFWNIQFTIKDPELYTDMNLYHKALYLNPSFELKLINNNNIKHFIWKSISALNSRWILIDINFPDKILFKYTYHIFKKSSIEQYSDFCHYDLCIILLSVSLLSTHMERKRSM